MKRFSHDRIAMEPPDPPLSEAEQQEALAEADLSALLNQALETHGVPMQDTVKILGIEFTVTSLDHGETAAVNHECRGFDLYTRELEIQRRLLARAITAINGHPVEIMALHKFLAKCPPAVVGAIFDRFHTIRLMQETAIAGVSDELKKEPPSPLKEGDGDSPSVLAPSLGTEG